MTALTYQSGFGNSFSTEALAGALPQARNSPQKCPYGLYAEQLSGTAFTLSRDENKRSWLYRIRPAALQPAFTPSNVAPLWTHEFGRGPVSPNRFRWNPLPIPEFASIDFIQGMQTWAGNGHCDDHSGISINLYAANVSMDRRVFYNADAEMLIVPQEGRLRFLTELGILEVEPQEIIVMPRGIRFKVELMDSGARGYLLENYGRSLRLPELGPIGSNGLANARDFKTPVAWFEEKEETHELIAKFTGGFWTTTLGHSPLDVVAWHGTHAPYKYDLRNFNAIGSISYDHPDPCIFTVLTAPSEITGAANIDFAIFPPRVLAMENTFRPPWFHRNVAGEFMGLIHGLYDAKADGFIPGGSSLHNPMSPHGPDSATFSKASNADLSQVDYVRSTMAFMFESRRAIRPTSLAMQSDSLQRHYDDAWSGLQKNFVNDL
ncbi:homogentisate 1,2-dioxygenase [Paenalcaligenes niemegkensis]|uniref:homogentisate 1,2-dioxygenase n=1 Tax=Paenalcaligenes niemegkensis TaxID=2895469 RepID=UPI001EE8C52D|nr:homogentisate 1,2-dioxygenase [Paenalcaligenes niemegkensis]MCQ9617240.1 homogentisate 1,2-dioxygenase [Paenalcaligenes niemegkensis]